MLREPRTSLYVLSCAKRCQISKKSSWQRGRMLAKASPSASKGAENPGAALCKAHGKVRSLPSS